MPSEAQKKADRKYKRDKTQQFCLRFYPGDSEIWGFLSKQDNKQGFLKSLISREMAQTPASTDTDDGRRRPSGSSDRHSGSGQPALEEAVRRERVESQ